MPKRSRTKSSASRARKAKTAKVVNVPKPLVVPDRMVVSMRYGTPITITAGALTYAQHIFSGNSIYDPDVSGVGTQPYGHDQYEALFNGYRVISSSVHARFWAADPNDYFIVFVVPTEESTGTVQDEAPLMPYVKTKPLGLSGVENPIEIKSDLISTEKFKGDPGAKYAREYAATFGSNPNSQWYWSVGAINTTSGGSTVTVRAYVTVEYTVELWSRKALSGS